MLSIREALGSIPRARAHAYKHTYTQNHQGKNPQGIVLSPLSTTSLPPTPFTFPLLSQNNLGSCFLGPGTRLVVT